MPIEGINNATSNLLTQIQGNGGSAPVRPPREEREEGQDRGARSAEREQRVQQFFGAVAQALESVGVKPPAPPPQAAAESGEERREPGQANVREAFNAFVGELFQSLRPQAPAREPVRQEGLGSAGTDATGGNRTGEPAPGSANAGTGGASRYADDIGSQLQNAIQTLASGNANGGQNTALKSAFDKLVQAARAEQPENGSANANAQPELQAFLRNLSQNLRGANPIGGAVNTLV